MIMRSKNLSPSIFGKNLKIIRKAQGLTQTELGNKAGVSTRMIAHYENWAGCPPVNKMVYLARSLGVSMDKLLGIKTNGFHIKPPEHPRIWNKLKQFESLSRTEQRVISKMLDSFLQKKKF